MAGEETQRSTNPKTQELWTKAELQHQKIILKLIIEKNKIKTVFQLLVYSNNFVPICVSNTYHIFHMLLAHYLLENDKMI